MIDLFKKAFTKKVTQKDVILHALRVANIPIKVGKNSLMRLRLEGEIKVVLDKLNVSEKDIQHLLKENPEFIKELAKRKFKEYVGTLVISLDEIDYVLDEVLDKID